MLLQGEHLGFRVEMEDATEFNAAHSNSKGCVLLSLKRTHVGGEGSGPDRTGVFQYRPD